MITTASRGMLERRACGLWSAQWQ